MSARDRADQRPRRCPDQREGDDDHDLGQGVIGDVGAEQPVHDFDQPPRQRRQLVGAEHPFAAVGERLDQIERQIGVKQLGSAVQTAKCTARKTPKADVGPPLDPGDQSGIWRGARRSAKAVAESDAWLIGICRRYVALLFARVHPWRPLAYRSAVRLWLRWRLRRRSRRLRVDLQHGGACGH